MNRRVFGVEPAEVVRAFRWRAIPHTVIQGQDGETVKATSVIKALRKVRLEPGAKVKVFVPAIVHARRVRPARARLL